MFIVGNLENVEKFGEYSLLNKWLYGNKLFMF